MGKRHLVLGIFFIVVIVAIVGLAGTEPTITGSLTNIPNLTDVDNFTEDDNYKLAEYTYSECENVSKPIQVRVCETDQEEYTEQVCNTEDMDYSIDAVECSDKAVYRLTNNEDGTGEWTLWVGVLAIEETLPPPDWRPSENGTTPPEQEEEETAELVGKSITKTIDANSYADFEFQHSTSNHNGCTYVIESEPVKEVCGSEVRFKTDEDCHFETQYTTEVICIEKTSWKVVEK